MNLTQWYAVSIAIIATFLTLCRIGSVASMFLVSRFRTLALKHIVYPLLMRRYWNGVTRLQGAMVGSYIIINGFCMGLGIRNTSELLTRSGVMASINLVPLFLGGRTSMIANFLGISLHTYYLAHHWIGRIVILQSCLHVALVIASGKPWTFDSSQISGISAASALALIFLLSLSFIRRLMYEFFLKVHLILAFIAVLALLKHLGPFGITTSIFPIVSLSIWFFNAILRLSRLAYYNSGGGRKQKPNQATITHFVEGSTDSEISAMRVTVRLSRKQKIRPGQYYYLFLSDMGTSRRFQSHPYVATWWDYPMAANTLSFLIQPQGGISAELVGRNSIRKVVLDGPYGKDLHLDNCETVILIAKGIGITGILPYARHMTDRRVLPDETWAYQYRRGLITRKIDVYWVLEDNSQEEWISDWIKDLHDLDEKNLILSFSCFYPHKKLKPPPVSDDPHWRFLYQQKALPIIEGLMVKQIQRSPGKTKVAVCGSSGFSDAIRNMVLKTMDEYRDVEFVETEYQPQGVRQAFPGIHMLKHDDMEMAAVKINRERRLVKSSTAEKSRLSKRSAITDDKEGLIKPRSGAATKLETVAEEAEIKDLDEGLLEKDAAGSKKEVKEMV